MDRNKKWLQAAEIVSTVILFWILLTNNFSQAPCLFGEVASAPVAFPPV